jgi:hypothetical protein
MSFAGGINNTKTEHDTKEDELVAGLNMFTDEAGAAYNRKGATLHRQFLGDTTGMQVFNFTNRGGTQEFLAVYDTNVYRDASGAWTALTGATVTSDLRADATYYSETDKWYLTNGTDDVVVYTSGSSATTDASFKKGKYIEQFDGRIITANVSSQEDYLWVSDLGTDSFGANSFQRAEGAIKGLMALGPRKLLVFTDKKVYRVPGFTNTPDAAGPEAFYDLGATFGSIADRTIVKLNGISYFLGLDSQNVAEVYASDGQRVLPIGGPKIKNYLNGLNAAALDDATAIADGRYYRLAVSPSGSTTNTREYLYDTITKKWLPEFRPGFPIGTYANIRTSSADTIYAGHQSLGLVYQLNSGRYDELTDQSYTSGQDADRSITGSTTVRAAQGFKLSNNAQTTRKINGGAVYLKKVGGTTTELTVRIETDDSGVPSGTLASANLTTTIDAITDTSYGWHNFSFSTPTALTGSTQYHLVIQHTTEGSGSSDYAWGEDSSSPTYSDGAASAYASGSWSAVAGSDLLFAVFIQEEIESYVMQTTHLGFPQYPKSVKKIQLEGQSSTGVTGQLGIGVNGKNSTFSPQMNIALTGKSNVWATDDSDTTENRLIWANNDTQMGDNIKWASDDDTYSLTLVAPPYFPKRRYLTFRHYFKGVGEFRINKYTPVFETIPTEWSK